MSKEKYINPFTDFGFKKLFGEETNKDLLIDFLNSLLSNEHKIIDLTFRKTEYLGSSELNRKAIFDLYCQDEKGQRFIVELQKAEQQYFKDRTIYYSTFPIQEQARKGEWNYQLEPIYCIGILDFTFEEDKDYPDKYFYRVALSDTETNKVFYDKLHFIYLEMPKFKKSEAELKTNRDKWLYFLKNLTKFEQAPEALDNEMFVKAFDIAEVANLSEDQKFAYEESMKYYRDMKNVIDKSYLDGEIVGFNKGQTVGFNKGQAVGFNKGQTVGYDKGIVEAKIKMAKNMIDKGFPLEVISEVTGLSVNEIENL